MWIHAYICSAVGSLPGAKTRQPWESPLLWVRQTDLAARVDVQRFLAFLLTVTVFMMTCCLVSHSVNLRLRSHWIANRYRYHRGLSLPGVSIMIGMNRRPIVITHDDDDDEKDITVTMTMTKTMMAMIMMTTMMTTMIMMTTMMMMMTTMMMMTMVMTMMMMTTTMMMMTMVMTMMMIIIIMAMMMVTMMMMMTMRFMMMMMKKI